MDLVEHVYALTQRFPPDERFRLTGQAIRSAISVPANVAEGHSRATRRDYGHFVAIARGSLMELETYVMIAGRLGYIDSKQTDAVLERTGELSRMLTALRRRLAEPPPPPANS